MRIISKYYDFYDYLQDPTDNNVFDRRKAFVLDKENIAKNISYCCHSTYSKDFYLLMQSGFTYWLFYLEVSKIKTYFEETINFEPSLVLSWKDYDKRSNLLTIDLISFGFHHYLFKDIDKNFNPEQLKNFIKNDEYRVECHLCYNYNYSLRKNEELIPILKASGISHLIDPLLLFCSIEEYFSAQKTAAERTEPLGATNDDKITAHGFDIKTSFRGTNNKRRKKKNG